jgi:hypothetical protein
MTQAIYKYHKLAFEKKKSHYPLPSSTATSQLSCKPKSQNNQNRNFKTNGNVIAQASTPAANPHKTQAWHQAP